MIDPLHPTPLSINIAIGVLGAFQSIIIDSILLIRLVAVYPPSFIGRRPFALLITVPVLLKIARIVNLGLFIKALVDATKDPAIANLLIGQIWEHAPTSRSSGLLSSLTTRQYLSLSNMATLAHCDNSPDMRRASSYTGSSFTTDRLVVS